jgi:hypothetical protein
VFERRTFFKFVAVESLYYKCHRFNSKAIRNLLLHDSIRGGEGFTPADFACAIILILLAKAQSQPAKKTAIPSNGHRRWIQIS